MPKLTCRQNCIDRPLLEDIHFYHLSTTTLLSRQPIAPTSLSLPISLKNYHRSPALASSILGVTESRQQDDYPSSMLLLRQGEQALNYTRK